MTGANTLILLHTGSHTGIWETVEVAFAVGVLLVSVGLVVRLLLDSRGGAPGSGLAEALSGDERRWDGSGASDGPPFDRRGD